MRVYRSQVRSIEPGHVGYGYWTEQPASVTVFEDTDARDTGLLDVRGNRIVSRNEIGPIGFNRDSDGV